MATDARYDKIADWYPSWVGEGGGLIAERAGGLLPPSIDGDRVLDVACGHGRASRGLARLGASVVGVDVSAELIARARALETADPLGVVYHAAAVGHRDEWWDGIAFDGAVCEMALMDIDDLAETISAVAATAMPAAWFIVSMVHPCFPGNEAGLSSWPPSRSYFDEGWWTSGAHNPDGVRIRVGSSHRTLSTCFNTFIDAGFTVDRVFEPPGPVPMVLLVRLRRGA